MPENHVRIWRVVAQGGTVKLAASIEFVSVPRVPAGIARHLWVRLNSDQNGYLCPAGIRLPTIQAAARGTVGVKRTSEVAPEGWWASGAKRACVDGRRQSVCSALEPAAIIRGRGCGYCTHTREDAESPIFERGLDMAS